MYVKTYVHVSVLKSSYNIENKSHCVIKYVIVIVYSLCEWYNFSRVKFKYINLCFDMFVRLWNKMLFYTQFYDDVRK